MKYNNKKNKMNHNYLQILNNKNFLKEIKKYNYPDEIMVKLGFYHIAVIMSECSGISSIDLDLDSIYFYSDYKNFYKYQIKGSFLTTTNKVFSTHNRGGYSCKIHNKFFQKKYSFTKNFLNDIDSYFSKFFQTTEKEKINIHYIKQIQNCTFTLNKKYLKQNEIYQKIYENIEKNQELTAILNYMIYHDNIVKQCIHKEQNFSKNFKV